MMRVDGFSAIPVKRECKKRYSRFRIIPSFGPKHIEIPEEMSQHGQTLKDSVVSMFESYIEKK